MALSWVKNYSCSSDYNEYYSYMHVYNSVVHNMDLIGNVSMLFLEPHSQCYQSKYVSSHKPRPPHPPPTTPPHTTF